MAVNPYLTTETREIFEHVRIGIAGAGGLGSNVAQHLVRAGILHLTVVDFDVVSESNLNRQFYFRDQIDLKKVEALKENLLRIEPTAEIHAVDAKLDAASARTLFADCEVVVEALDSAAAKAMLLAALMPLGKKLVAASGIAGWGNSNAIRVRPVGERLVMVGDGATDVTDNTPPESPRVGIVAAMQANTALAWILGKEF